MTRDGKPSDYDLVMSEVYTRLRIQHPEADSFYFDKALIEQVAAELVSEKRIKIIKNLPDLKYTYDARRDFPTSMLADGFWGIAGKGKGKYLLTRLDRNNLIRIPENIGVEVTSLSQVDQTHPIVAKVLGNDEQATLRRIEANSLISDFLGFDAKRLQGHERTFLSCGQIEVDEVYVGTDGLNDYVIPISAKGGFKDYLSYTQALNLSLYALEKPQFQNYIGRPLGVWQQPNGPIYVIEFNSSDKIEDLRICRAKAYHLTNFSSNSNNI